MSPVGVDRVPCAPRWYLTSPLPPSSLETTASIVRSPSNSRRIDLVRPPDDVREDVEPAAMRHPEHDLVGAVARGELDRLVEHRDHHVEALDGELLLPEERAAQVALHPLDLAQAPEQPHALVARERAPVAARLDRLAQPDALLVVGDVLDLVRDRPACTSRAGAAARRRASRPRRAGGAATPGCAPAAPASASGSGARARARGRRAARSRAGRGAPRGGRACGYALTSAIAAATPPSSSLSGAGSAARARSGRGRWRAAAARRAAPRGRLRRRPRARAGARGRAALAGAARGLALEEVAPLLGHGAGIVEVLLEEQRGVPGVQPVDVGTFHVHACCSSGAGATRAGGSCVTATVKPRKRQTAQMSTAAS